MPKVNPVMNTASMINKGSHHSNHNQHNSKRHASIVHPSSSTSVPLSFQQALLDEILAHDLTCGFEESEKCFSELCSKAAHLINAENCFIFLKNDAEHNLYTYIQDPSSGEEIKITKPLDRGITGFVVEDANELLFAENDVEGEEEDLLEIDNQHDSQEGQKDYKKHTTPTTGPTLILDDVTNFIEWEPELDEIPIPSHAHGPAHNHNSLLNSNDSTPNNHKTMAHTNTKSYLSCPIWDTGTSQCIGAVEFRNKLIPASTKKSSKTRHHFRTHNAHQHQQQNAGVFTNIDAQVVRIFALQIGAAVTYSRQNALLAGRCEAFTKAYNDQVDVSEAICLPDTKKMLSRRSSITRPNDLNMTNIRANAFVRGTSNDDTQTLSDSLPTFPFSPNYVHLSQRGWDYDVMEQSEEELTMHAVDIFDERGLFSRYSIPKSIFLNFLEEIKKGYHKNTPYHNYHHAFDVMHVCYLIMTKCQADEFLESFNILSILVASLAHDLGHDGFNNTFHASTNSELAVTYNGVSILENYSAAYLFRILRKKRCNILAGLGYDSSSGSRGESQTQFHKMRIRLIDMILDTDAKNHFVLMTRFKHGLEMKQLSRGLLSSMILHVADVSNPVRPSQIARKWAFVVQEEFFIQGDKEKELKLAVSPFMDREYENLPRMQNAFIDAVVNPVFSLLSEFLPLIREHCIKPLLFNRAFWSQMQSRDMVKTVDVMTFVTKQQSDVMAFVTKRKTGSVNEKHKSGDVTLDNISPLQESSRESRKVIDQPIPGIPAGASIRDREQSVRKVSLVSFGSSENIDEELGNLYQEQNKQESIRQRIIRGGKVFKTSSRKVIHKTRSASLQVLESTPFQVLVLVTTIYALFGYDLNILFGKKELDVVINIITVCVLIFFVLELLVSLYCVPKYIRFFFWLDLIASLSLLLEMDFLFSSDRVNFFGLAKAGRAARVGARAGRVAKILRLIRLAKVAKLMKWVSTFRRSKQENAKKSTNESSSSSNSANVAIEEVDYKMSVVGREMTASITKKVILAVLIMLLVFSLLDAEQFNDSRQLGLDMIAEYSESDLLQDVYIEYHPDIIKLQGIGPDTDFIDTQAELELRDKETAWYFASQDPNISAVFDVKEEIQAAALYSIATTVTVILLLALLSWLFSRDAFRIMIRPIEKMKNTVQQLSENPLLHLEKIKQRSEGGKKGSNDSVDSDGYLNETDMLEQAITKMATLLQIGFGTAGAEIIAKSFSDYGELDPMVPGVRVNAIFGFCDIRDFTFATEGLQQDVMLFVNRVAEIIHHHVVESGGAPNKNIGDAFLLVWKLDSSANGGRSYLQKEVFDAALVSFQKIISEIKRIGNLAAFIQEETNSSSAWRSSLKDFQVNIGFGLHEGWAIEGSIGSKLKVDASYLSPHVNLASRLETATKHYHVPLLMSEAFVTGLTGTMQSTCRRCDRVTFKGSNEPMTIYVQDSGFEHLKKILEVDKEHNVKIQEATKPGDNEELKKMGIDTNAVLESLNSSSTLNIREVYDEAFNAYLNGDWDKSKVLFHFWLKSFPGDTVATVLVEYLIQHNFICPSEWKGYHSLKDK